MLIVPIDTLRQTATEDQPGGVTVARVSTPRSLTLPDGVRRRKLSTPRAEFATLQAGDGPLVLLVPGWTGSKEDFTAVLPPLAEAGHRAVAIDQRGQFETPGSGAEDSYTLAALADDVLAVASRLAEPGRPTHLVGHSFGGLVARTALVRRPAVFATLTLLGSGPAGLPADRTPLLTRMAEAIPVHGLAATWQAKRAYERSQGAPELPADIENFLRRRFLSSDPVALRAMTNHLTTAPDEVADLRSTGVPVLVVFGESDDGWPPAVQHAMAAELAAPVRVIAGAGHSPSVERPDATVAVLTEFWATAHDHEHLRGT